MGNSNISSATGKPGGSGSVAPLDHIPTDNDPPPGLSEIFQCLSALAGTGHPIELRALKINGTTHPARWRFKPGDFKGAAQKAFEWSGRCSAVYWTINSLDSAMPVGELKGKGADATAENITRRVWLLLDFDPVRTGTVNSTNTEKEAARKLANDLESELSKRGWPDPVIADSGNGWHALYRIDLPNDPESEALVKSVLTTLGELFDKDDAKVDRKVFDAPRICKVYGTLTCKGTDTPERPARYSSIVSMPEMIETVTREQLKTLAAEYAPKTATFDLNNAIERKRDNTEAAETKPTKHGLVARASTSATIDDRVIKYLAKIDPAIEGQGGSSQTIKACCKIGPGFDLTPDHTFRMIATHYNPRCQPPWSDSLLRRKVDEAYKLEKRRGWLLERNQNSQSRQNNVDPVFTNYARTDVGNCQRMATLCSNKIRYVHPWNKWLIWDGMRWAFDDTGSVMRFAKKTVESIMSEAVREGSKNNPDKDLVKWWFDSQCKTRLEAMIALAASENGIPALPQDLDQHPWLLNCRNGTIDLRSETLKPHDKANMITKLAPVEFDPDAKCPHWESTLELFIPNREVRDYWQRLCGMALTGVIEDHILPIAYGEGSNGKSTILGALLDVLGPDYAMKAAPDLLLAKNNDSHPTDKADLFGKRVVVVNETDDGRRLNEALVKELTGGDKIRARRMREDFWEFSPTHTVFMATNHKPVVRGTDHAIWRRLQLIPFGVKVETEDAKKDMPVLLRDEASGILSWFVRGCLEWQKNGLMPPDTVQKATSQYRRDEDVLGSFIEQECITQNGVRCIASQLYSRYKKWSEESGINAQSLVRFGKAIDERGFCKEKSSVIYYLGIGLRSENEPDITHKH